MKFGANSLFICYRRADDANATDRIYGRLRGAFGKRAIFRDIDTIPLGSEFRDHIQQALGSARVGLVVIGKRWLEPHGDKQPRLYDPQDHVAAETKWMLERPTMIVIPVLVDNASLPTEEMMPESLRPLLYRSGKNIRPDPDFESDMDQLIRYFKRLPNPPPAPKPTPAPPSPVIGAFRVLVIVAAIFAILFFSGPAILSTWGKYQQWQRVAVLDRRIEALQAELERWTGRRIPPELVASTVGVRDSLLWKQEIGEERFKTIYASLIESDLRAASAGKSSLLEATPQPARRLRSLQVELNHDQIAEGEAVYKSACVACHQPNGNGLPSVFPPLVKSEYVSGDSRKFAAIILHGLTGPTVVDGKSFQAIPMPSQGETLDDKKIAAVMTYTRSTFWRSNSAVSADVVAGVRKEFSSRKTPWTDYELKNWPDTSNRPSPATPSPTASTTPVPAPQPPAPAPPKPTPRPASELSGKFK